MRNRDHLSFDTAASASDRYFGAGAVASQYATQMMEPGRIIAFRCYGATAGEQAIVRNTAPVYFVSGDRISVYISYSGATTTTTVAVYKNGAIAGSFSYNNSAGGDIRNQAWNATVLVEYL